MKFPVYCLVVLMFCCCTHHEENAAGKLDAFDHYIGTSNWQVVKETDTSYIYFSRINDVHINVYHYRISQGDSVQTTLDSIVVNNNAVSWTWNKKMIVLGDMNDSTALWYETVNTAKKYVFQKKDSSH